MGTEIRITYFVKKFLPITVATLKLIYASPARLRYRDADSRAMEEG